MIEDLSVPVPVPNGLIAHLNPKQKKKNQLNSAACWKASSERCSILKNCRDEL
jgi:hypothetical protein